MVILCLGCFSERGCLGRGWGGGDGVSVGLSGDDVSLDCVVLGDSVECFKGIGRLWCFNKLNR